jgi:hypothetical protein
MTVERWVWRDKSERDRSEVRRVGYDEEDDGAGGSSGGTTWTWQDERVGPNRQTGNTWTLWGVNETYQRDRHRKTRRDIQRDRVGRNP